MNQIEICRLLNIRKDILEKALDKVRKEDERIDNIIKRRGDFKLNDCIKVVSEINGSELMLEYLKENYTEKEDTGWFIKGTDKFLKNLEKNPTFRCCNTCEYLKGKLPKNCSLPHPYCSVYDVYLNSIKAKVYEDWCSSYQFKHFEKPRKWLRKNAPTNINMYGETDTVNGIKRSEFKSSEQTKKNEPIKLVNQVGFD